MSDKVFNGRIQQKHGTAAEWSLATNFKPLDGELIIYDADADYNYPRFKVGDGINYVNDLPFSDDDIWAAIEDLPTKTYIQEYIETALVEGVW